MIYITCCVCVCVCMCEFIKYISLFFSTAYDSAILILPDLIDLISDPFKTIPASNSSLKK